MQLGWDRGSDWVFLRGGGGWTEVAAEAGHEGTTVKWISMGMEQEVAEGFCSGRLWRWWRDRSGEILNLQFKVLSPCTILAKIAGV